MQRGNIRLKQGELDDAQDDFDNIVSSLSLLLICYF